MSVKMLRSVLQNYRQHVESDEFENINVVCQQSYKELSICASILERCFSDLPEELIGEVPEIKNLDNVLRALNLRIDEKLSLMRSKYVKLISYGQQYARVEAEKFLRNVVDNGKGLLDLGLIK